MEMRRISIPGLLRIEPPHGIGIPFSTSGEVLIT